jgi:hypothetical protein
LACRGAKVILACRDLKTGKIACGRYLADSDCGLSDFDPLLFYRQLTAFWKNNSNVEVHHLDLGRFRGTYQLHLRGKEQPNKKHHV